MHNVLTKFQKIRMFGWMIKHVNDSREIYLSTHTTAKFQEYFCSTQLANLRAERLRTNQDTIIDYVVTSGVNFSTSQGSISALTRVGPTRVPKMMVLDGAGSVLHGLLQPIRN